MEAHH